MVSNYTHHLFPKQSEFVKYRGKTGQIDIKDTIVGILAKNPGLTAEDIAAFIFDKRLYKSFYKSVPYSLKALVNDSILVKEDESGFYYLSNDAMSHDIQKTQQMMDRLLAKGLKPEQVTFLSSSIIMAGEQARAEHEGRNYHSNETVAASPAIVPPTPEKQEVVDFDGVKMVEVEPGVHEPITISTVDAINDDTKSVIELHAIEPEDIDFQNYLTSQNVILEIVGPEVHGYNIKLYGKRSSLINTLSMFWENLDLIDQIEPFEGDVIKLENPFEKLSEADLASIKEDTITQMRLDAEAEEHERLRLIAEKEEQDRLAAIAAEEARIKAEEEAKVQAYKNKLSSIRSATDLLGLDVEVNLPDLAGQVVGTILEIKPDGVLFLIVFSKDSKYPEGSIQNIFYKDNLSYKIMA